MMLTDAAREHASPEKLQSFFSPASNAAYEIQHGRRTTHSGEYVFPVMLFGVSGSSKSQACTLVLRRERKDDWAVDRLP